MILMNENLEGLALLKVIQFTLRFLFFCDSVCNVSNTYYSTNSSLL